MMVNCRSTVLITTSEKEILLDLCFMEDVAMTLVKTCYNLEGDKFLAPIAFDLWMTMHDFVIRTHDSNRVLEPIERAPILFAQIAQLYPNPEYTDAYRETVFNEIMERITPLAEKVAHDTKVKMQQTLDVMRACRLVNFKFVAERAILFFNSDADAELKFLRMFPSLNEAERASIKMEFPEYKAHADVFHAKYIRMDEEPTPEDLWYFWKVNEHRLPHCYKLAVLAALATTSSCFVERVFSVYVGMFTELQESSLEDYRECVMLLRVNQNNRKKEANDLEQMANRAIRLGLHL